MECVKDSSELYSQMSSLFVLKAILISIKILHGNIMSITYFNPSDSLSAILFNIDFPSTFKSHHFLNKTNICKSESSFYVNSTNFYQNKSGSSVNNSTHSSQQQQYQQQISPSHSSNQVMYITAKKTTWTRVGIPILPHQQQTDGGSQSSKKTKLYPY